MESPANLPDEELIAQFKASQLSRHEFIKTLFERYYDLLYVIASRNGLDQFSTEEVITDTFISLPDQIAAYKGKSTFKSYLNLLFKYRVLKYKKRHQKIKSLEIATDPGSLDEFVGQIDPTDQQMINKESYSALYKVIDSLSETERTILILWFYEGASSKEIGNTLGMTSQSVRKRIQIIRRKLRDRLERMNLSLNDMV